MPKLRSSSFNTEKAAQLLGGQVHLSLSRVQLAYHIDRIFVGAIKLFDPSTITRMDQFLMKYARLKIFQKMQTLFQMGRKDELVELLTYVRNNIDEMISLANDPNCFMTISGKLIDENQAKEAWNKPLPKWLVPWMESTYVWKELEREIIERKAKELTV
jgi:hypothetical protein